MRASLCRILILFCVFQLFLESYTQQLYNNCTTTTTTTKLLKQNSPTINKHTNTHKQCNCDSYTKQTGLLLITCIEKKQQEWLWL